MNCDSNRDIDCLIVGYAGVDRIIRVDRPARPGQTSIILNADNHRVTYGGNGSNVAVCMGRLGCRPTPLMRVGEDWEALGYRQMLEDSGVDLRGITVVKDETTSICHLIEDQENNHLTMTYPGAMNARYAPKELDDELFRRARYGLITVATRPDVELFFRKAQEHGLPIVFGVRVDMESFPLPLFEQILLNAEIIFMNDVERQFIEDQFGLRPITALFDRGRAKIIAVTLGRDGSAVYERTAGGVRRTHVSAVKCRQVVDATGAGDSYIAGFLYGILKGRDAADCAGYASATASFVIEKVGCTDGAPNEEEMLLRYAAGTDMKEERHDKR